MPDYRRIHLEGGTYFSTLVTAQRSPAFAKPETRLLLRQAIQKVRRQHPFGIVGMVILPDHLHTISRLPQGDSDFPTRWRLIKTHMTQHAGCGQRFWQPRYWEHAIRDDVDLARHLDYIHWNPLKHSLVSRVEDWPWSSFHRYVAAGVYPLDWCGSPALADYAFG